MELLSFRCVAGLSPSRTWFDPRAVTMGFVADNDALLQILHSSTVDNTCEQLTVLLHKTLRRQHVWTTDSIVIQNTKSTTREQLTALLYETLNRQHVNN